MSTEGKHIVFVYGTLKTGLRNHCIMMNPDRGSAKFLSMAETVVKYPMIKEMEYHVPFLLHLEGEGEHVEGELYEVDDDKLASLDELEGHPNFYQRLLTKVKPTDSECPTSNVNILECWAYFITSYRPEVLNLPRLKSFTNSIFYNIAPEEKQGRVNKLKMFVKGSI